MRFSNRALAVALASVLALTACSSSETTTEPTDAPSSGSSEATGPATSGDPIKIGSLHPTTGGLALDGNQMEQAVLMAVEDINASGGIAALGNRPLEALTADTTGAADVGSAEAERLISEGAVALIGAFQSAVTTNIAAVSQRSEVPLVIDVAVSDDITAQGNQFVFRIQPNATAMGTFGARNLKAISDAAGTPVTKVAYLHEETAFGNSVFAAFAAEASLLGIEIVEEISYNAFEVTDLTTEVQQAIAQSPDVVAATGYYNDGLLLASNLAAVAPELSGVFGVANGAFDLPQFPTDSPGASEGFLDSNYHFDQTNPETADVRARFLARTGEEMRTPAVFAYQAVTVIAAGLESAGSDVPSEVRDGIAGISLADHLFTFPGPIEFDDRGENINAQPVVMQVQGGVIVQVFPAEFAEADPVFPIVPWS
ncbi:MAG: branched-chain amino acid transport system substrate-binding protein [Glaciecola sp.]|jgi:branched-chain amino acid transport system substrate-binding protein